jgi:nucleoside phosphorylase
MSDPARILVVAATARELATHGAWRTLTCGVGPVEAAIATTAAIAAHRPDAIVHVGIAGGRCRRALAPASIVIGTDARYEDLRVPAEWAPAVVAPDARLLAQMQRALPQALTLSIGTSARVGGTLGGPLEGGVDVEAMEGFAVLRAAQRLGVPAIEVRAIANEIEESDRARWHVEAAFAAITDVTPTLVEAALAAIAPDAADHPRPRDPCAS